MPACLQCGWMTVRPFDLPPDAIGRCRIVGTLLYEQRPEALSMRGFERVGESIGQAALGEPAVLDQREQGVEDHLAGRRATVYQRVQDVRGGEQKDVENLLCRGIWRNVDNLRQHKGMWVADDDGFLQWHDRVGVGAIGGDLLLERADMMA